MHWRQVMFGKRKIRHNKSPQPSPLIMNRPDETWHRLLKWTYGQAPSERLAGQILLDEGFKSFNPSHPLGGQDGGKDAFCMKDGQRWIMAAYFPRDQQTFKEIKDKFIGDLAGVAKNDAKGIAFVTNQELRLAERKELEALCETVLLEVFHLERIATILDKPHMAPVRQQFLHIDTPPEKLPSGCLLTKDWSELALGDVKDGHLHLSGERHKLYALPVVEAVASIPSLLTWSSRIPAQLMGRDDEMADLRAWANRPDPLHVRVMHGGGGVGKTRLAVEFGIDLCKAGWQACLLGDSTYATAFQPGEQGTLLIIDYPEQHPQAVDNLMRRLKSGVMPDGRWRVLLLSRNDQIAQTLDQIVPNLRAQSLALTALASVDAAWELFQAGSARMREVRAASTPAPTYTQAPAAARALARGGFDAWLARDARHADPLMILAFALNLLYDPNATALGWADILDSLVRHEIERIKRSLVGFPKEQIRGAILLKALASLTGGLTHADVEEFGSTGLTVRGLALPDVLTLKDSALWQDGMLPEIAPDILAAQMIHLVLKDYLATDARIGAWVWRGLIAGGADEAQLRSRLSRLARLSLDWTGRIGGQYCLIDALQVDQDMAARLEPVFETDVQLEWPLFGLAVAVGKLRLVVWAAGAAADFTLYGPGLATSLNNLSNRLADRGDRADALAAIQRAVTIYEGLSRQNFVACGPDLAMSLNNLSMHMAAQGDQVGALAAIQRAVTIYEDLSRQNFAAYGPDLAMSLNNLSNRLADQGDRAGGLATIQRAVEIDQNLSRQNFAAYEPALARSLNNLSVRLAEQGDRAGALVAIQRAVTIREELSRQNFAGYGPDLATSLNNFSARLAEHGDHAGALAAIQRAVTIDEELSRQNPVRYAPDLAGSLTNLALLSDDAIAITLLERAITLIAPHALPGTTHEKWHKKMLEDLHQRRNV
jgi:hypothetical protein